VTWPTRLEIANLTVVVILVSILLGFVLGGFDLFFSWVVEQTLFR
jgi:preprotein translocase SecE subunit